MEGWIKLHRQLIEWEWYKDVPTKVLFIHLLLVANRDDKKWKGIDIKRGQHLTSLDKLANATGLKKQSVRTAIKHLISTRELTQQSTSQYTVFTVVNYEKYQELTHDLTCEQHTANIQLTSNKNKENKENKKKKIYMCPDEPEHTKTKTFVKPSVEEVAQYCGERANGIDAQRFYDFYESKGWLVGKVKMKDWRASVRTWERNSANTAQLSTEKPVITEDDDNRPPY